MLEAGFNCMNCPHDPLIARGISVSPETQVGFYGSLPQVLYQQGYAGYEPSMCPLYLATLQSLQCIRDEKDQCLGKEKELFEVNNGHIQRSIA